MANPIGFPEVAAAIGLRWASSGLDATVAGGIRSNSPPERTPRPYAILGSLGDVPITHTAKARYDDVAVTIELVADDMDRMRPILAAIRGAFGEDALTALETTNGAVFLKMFPGRVTYLEEANYLRAICEYTVKIKQNRVS